MNVRCVGIWENGRACVNEALPGASVCRWHNDRCGIAPANPDWEYCLESDNGAFVIARHHKPACYTLPVFDGGLAVPNLVAGIGWAAMQILGRGDVLYCRTADLEQMLRDWLIQRALPRLTNGERVPGAVLAARVKAGPPSWGQNDGWNKRREDLPYEVRKCLADWERLTCIRCCQ